MIALRARALLAIALCAWSVTAQSKPERDHRAVAAFKAANPCPSTGKPRGACPGHIVDHITALACGGADHPDNMQWQTIADAKAKDKWERKGCRNKSTSD